MTSSLTDVNVGNEAVTKGALIKTGFCPFRINIKMRFFVRVSILYHDTPYVALKIPEQVSSR